MTDHRSGTRPAARLDPTRLVRRIGPRQLRLASGLTLFSYLLSHFANHALGNVSVDAMEAGLAYHVALWHSVPGTLLLYSALVVHAALGLWALYERRHFRWKMVEGVQLAFGLAIPAMVAAHFVGQRVALGLYGIEKSYAQTLYTYWVTAPQYGVLQAFALCVAWTHGCIGVYLWLRMKPRFPQAAPFLLALAVLLPALALLGFYQGGRAVAQASASPVWDPYGASTGQPGSVAQNERLREIRDLFLWAWAGAIGLALAARGMRTLLERRRGMIRLTYPEGRTIRVPRGLSVLESSMRFNIPHASVCGGRGRCSTCRIRIVGDRSTLPAPSPREAAVLKRVGFGTDPTVRLACQLRPDADLTLVPLLPPNAGAAYAHGAARTHDGEERYIVSMFVDMRGSTRMASVRLPFDTVFIINRFLTSVSHAIVEAGGQPNQFLGDGLLALFGIGTSPSAACRQALDAAALIGGNVEQLNALFAADLHEPIRFGIGIHGGEVIIGDIGYHDHRVFTALGDPVNVAARLQEMTKTLGCEVVLSDDVRKAAGVAPDALPSTEVTIRGRTEPMRVSTVRDARSLAQARAMPPSTSTIPRP